MSNENIERFQEAAQSDEALRERMNEVLAKATTEEHAEKLAAFAAGEGYAFSAEEFREFRVRRMIMRKTMKRAVAVALAAALALPMTVSDVSEAAAKPALSVKGKVSIYTGQKKTVLIKNVKKADVKSLKVVSKNTGSTKVVKKILQKKKVGFVLKAVGPHASSIEVSLRLKKKIGGKNKYSFELTTITGAKDAPDVNLVDGVKQKDHHATVFKVGAEPEKWENWIELGIGNVADIDKRNLDIQWNENGVEADDATDGSMMYRPDTSAIKDTEKGYDEGTVSCTVTNCISGESDTDEHTFRVVSQDYIDQVTKGMQDFISKYPYKSASDIPTDQADSFEKDFWTMVFPFGTILGMTNDTVSHFGGQYLAAKGDASQDVSQVLSAEADTYETECKQNAENLGIPESDVTTFCDLLDLLMQLGLSNETNDPAPAPDIGDGSDGVENASGLTFNFCQNGAIVARVLVKAGSHDYCTDSLDEHQKQSLTLDSSNPEAELKLKLEVWVFGWWDTYSRDVGTSLNLTCRPGTVMVDSYGALGGAGVTVRTYNQDNKNISEVYWNWF